MEITAQKILAAVPELIEFSFDLINDYYCKTWQCSYLRLIEILPDSEAKSEHLLALALSRNPAQERELPDWLPGCQFVAASDKELKNQLEQAIDDLIEATEPYQDSLKQILTKLTGSEGKSIFKIETKNSAGPNQTGITEQICWLQQDRFYLLSIHHES